ncbi:ribonuclease HII [Lentilactobacillus senioris]|uniref:ribonuclease HII n=1 Tax=Lentilactobacillus senioris TaxID=931534 RepID=UPI003D2D1EED
MSEQLTVKQIEEQLKKVDSLNDPLFLRLKIDPRSGVQKAIVKNERRLHKQQERQIEFQNRFKYEQEFWHQGINYVAGIDEVGRGPLAGPVVAAAVILPKDFDLIEVNDSKQLSANQRANLAPLIRQEALGIGIGEIDNMIIDRVNIYEAAKLAMQEALSNLTPAPEQLIIDAMKINTVIPQLSLIKGDAKSISISAASIVAKVYRDQIMSQYAQQYPGYGFENNDGYGTKEHLTGLELYGVTPIHRQSFSPVKKFMK